MSWLRWWPGDYVYEMKRGKSGQGSAGWECVIAFMKFACNAKLVLIITLHNSTEQNCK
jgi:hypothetical protein